jgi:hypothetical protein
VVVGPKGEGIVLPEARRELCRSRLGDGQVIVPPGMGVKPGRWLLTVRGSLYELHHRGRPYRAES